MADALSRHDVDDASVAGTGSAVLCACSRPSFTFVDDVRRAIATAADTQSLRQRLDAGDLQGPWKDGEARVSRVVFIGRKLDPEAIRAGFLDCAA